MTTKTDYEMTEGDITYFHFTCNIVIFKQMLQF